MIQIENKTECCGCFACVNACPKKCIAMKFDAEGFLYPAVDMKACVDCKICESVCPIKKERRSVQVPSSYGGYAKDSSIRENSSSGGTFSLLAESVIEKGGAVFGAAYSDDFLSVHHDYALGEEDLIKFRTSKYVQSSTDDTYAKAKAFLESGRIVLYTGTPCQIAGLKAYLKQEYENLITQDVICHGVPSPAIWRDYVTYREIKAKARAKKVSTRSKKYGWHAYSLSFCADNEKKYISRYADDMYLRGFLKNMYLRPSCYDCKFRSGKSGSDITVADFWGVENVIPEFNDDKGVSLILINSEKGKILFEQIKSKLNVIGTDPQRALDGNPAYYRSVSIPEQRDEFFAYFIANGTIKALKKYVARPRWEIAIAKVKRQIRRMAKKLLRR